MVWQVVFELWTFTLKYAMLIPHLEEEAMVLIVVTCCQSDRITTREKTNIGKQRYRCQDLHCPHQSLAM
jgi:hypothetical protein